MSEEKECQLLLRLPESIRKRIKETVTEGSVSDFMVGLFLEYEKNHSPKAEEKEDWDEIYRGLPENLQKLLDAREKIMDMKDFETFKQDFLAEERNLAESYHDSYTPTDVDETKFPPEAKEYFDAVEKLFVEDSKVSYEDSQKWAVAVEAKNRILKKEAEIRYYNGDPDEMVYKGITREKIYNQFLDKTKVYSVSRIAGALHLSYQVAYGNIVPWMKNERFKIGREK
jgi:hypothetical protein